MKSKKFLLTTFAVLIACCPTVQAEDEELKTLARAYFKVLQTEGMTSVGKFMHPDALSSFKEMMLPVLESEAESGQTQLQSLMFGKKASIESIRNEDPESFMNKFMNIIAAQAEAGDVRINFDEVDILGVVPEDDQRHILVRVTVGVDELEITEFDVLSYIPFEDSWKLQLNGDIKGLAAALAAQY